MSAPLARLATCCLIALFSLEALAMNLTRDGQPAASIVLPAEPTELEQQTADELVQYIEQMSGATLAIGTEPAEGLVPLYIGAAADPQLLQQAESLPEGSFTLRVAAQRVDLAGSGEGVYYASSELLEQLGMRWFMPGELGTVVPDSPTLTLVEQTTTQSPGFTGRHFQMPHKDWQQRLRCGGPIFPGAHGLKSLSHPRTSKEYFEEHPEYYALIDGQRVRRQQCISNPEVLQIVINDVKEYFRQRPEQESTGLGPNDGAGFCECEECHALDGGDFDPFSGERSVTDRYVWFFNQVLKGIEDEFPDKKIAFYIYHNYMRPPQKVKPDPRITGALAPIALCRIHGPRNPICPEKQYYEWLAMEWGKIMPELWERGYWSNLACPGFPFVIVHRLRDQIPMGRDAGIYGWRVETFPHWGTQLPSMYIAAKLMWNPDADVDALMADFAETFFGPASEPMGAYIDLINTTLRDTDHHTGCAWDFHHIYDAEVRGQLRDYLRQAQGQVQDGSIYARRVQLMGETLDMLDGFVEMMIARVAVDMPAAKAGLDKLDAAGQKLLAYEPPMVAERMFTSYMRRFYRHCTEQGYARVTDGNTLLAACQDTWSFLLDPDSLGEELGYFKPDLRGGNWQERPTSSVSWSTQGLRYYKGIAWYRQTVQLPEDIAGTRVFLWSGGVDETAKVWINGKPIGVSHGATFYPFEMDATDVVKGGENVIAIAVSNERVNELGTGGIVAPIILYAPAAGADAELENFRDLRPTFP